MMEDSVLKCPICCDETFDTRLALVDHLSGILANLTCPICSNKWSSLVHLIEHLTLDNCQPENTVPIINLQLNEEPTNIEHIRIEPADIEQDVKNKLEELENKKTDGIESNEAAEYSPSANDTTDEGTDVSRMYVEFLSKQLAKPCLQNQELKLVKDGEVSRYVFVTNDDSDLDVDAGSAVVTKQNNDGTISMTTVRDLKMESASDTLITQESQETIEENQEEIYSCNTCGVSFTSVLDHIQSYHNDQDVVVEEPMEEVDSEPNTVPLELYDPLMEDVAVEKVPSRRMITETGDIVETPLVLKNTSISLEQTDPEKPAQPQIKEEVMDKQGRTFSRRYVVVDKFCDSVVKDINQTNDTNGPYHKVVVKEMETQGGEKIKVFNCMSCHIYVSNLDDFKTRPCKASTYPCPYCPVSYDNSKSLCAHLKVHKSKRTDFLNKTQEVKQKETPFECPVCNTEFLTHKSLKLHKRMHDPIKSRPIQPPVEIAGGMEVSKDTYLCSICNKLIPEDYRTVHVASHREGKREFHCDVCNKMFKSRDYLEMHMSVHSLEKAPVNKQDKSLPYNCVYCTRRFARPHEKVKHERIHTGEKPHSCEICGKSFRVSYCLTLHMRTHTGARPYSCKHCGKRFKAHSVYNHHMLTHSEVRAYKCPYCPKAFKTSVQLAGHKNSHTKPFSCPHCNRPFASLYAVRVHTETHLRQNNLKFSCSLCGASYARAFALKDHIKQVHKKEAEKADHLTSLIDTDWIVVPDQEENTPKAIKPKTITNEVDITDLTIVDATISNELVVP